MKKKDKNGLKDEKIIVGVLLLVILLFGIFFFIFLYPKLKNPYKIEDRVAKIEEKREVYSENVVGWLRVEGTNIDYPVIYNDDAVDVNTVRYNFLWTNASSKKLGNREIIFGHNIQNVSKTPIITDPNHERFEQLMSFIYYDFAKENQYIQYTINGENYLYKIFAVGFIDDTELRYFGKNFGKEELKDYIDKARKESFYRYSIDVGAQDDIISLVTCTRFYGMYPRVDFKIDARRVRENEDNYHYEVAESTKYDKIKEEMKGDGADEEL